MDKEYLWAPNTPSKPRLMMQQIDVVLHAGGVDDVNIGESNILIPPSSKKRRKNNDRSHERPKKKVYRPKVFEENKTTKTKTETKRTYKFKAKNLRNTPKPSTPKQKKSYGRSPSSCKHPLFVEDPVSLPFLEKFKALKIEEGGLENSTFKIEVENEYNFLEIYNNSCLVESRRIGVNFPKMCKKKRTNRGRSWLAKLSQSLMESRRIGANFPKTCRKKRTYRERPCLEKLSQCLMECRRIGANFPKLCKKKRINRERPRLEKFLTPFKKGQRTKSFIRKKRKEMGSLIKKIQYPKQKRGQKAQQGLVIYKEAGNGQLVPYKEQHPDHTYGKVDLDEDTLKVWKLLLHEEEHEEKDEDKRKYWEHERKLYHEAVQEFMYHMHFILGDRRFLPWKGSVVDSVIGAYLTQNVSDHLSSSAFMSLAAKFPIKNISCGEGNEDLTTPDSQESTGSNVVPQGPKLDKDMEDSRKVEEMVEAQKDKEDFSKVENNETENDFSLMTIEPDPTSMISSEKKLTVKKKNMSQEEKKMLSEELKKDKQRHWDAYRKMHTKSTRHSDHEDSVDWEAVRCAEPSIVAEAIVSRGQQNRMTERVQGLLNHLKELYGNLDLEWLRYAPPKEAKEYLLNRGGLGLKSVECIRLLTLKQNAFPVDVNVGRIAVRLGWVPLKPLPEPMQIHELEKFPLPEKIQQYLWPRLCTLDPLTLYEFHYQLITFGKVFCTKKNPNCAACPMKLRCKHFQSANASSRPAISETPDQRPKDDQEAVTSIDNANSLQQPTCPTNSESTLICEVNNVPTIEEQAIEDWEPIIEMPASPAEAGSEEFNDEFEINNDEEFYKYDVSVEIPTIKLSSQEHLSTTHNCSFEDYDSDMKISTSLVALSAYAVNVPMPKMKDASRLRTEHLVYVLTDNHPLLAEHAPREPNDPFPYLLVIWTTGELENSCESTSKNSSQEEDHNTQTVPGTLLIPCRTAMGGSFPLNGTYFQTNEVFADYDSSKQPISVPRKWLWNLEKRVAYFGTGISSIMRGLSMEQIHNCFWKGFVCVRAIDAKTKAPRPLLKIFHLNTTTNHGNKNKNGRVNEDESEQMKVNL